MLSQQEIYNSIMQNKVAHLGQADILRLRHGIYPNALLLAVQFANLSTLQVLYQKLTAEQQETLITDIDTFGRNAIILAVRVKSLEKVRYLISLNYIDLEQECNNDMVALEYSIEQKDPKIFEYLVVQQASIDFDTWHLIFNSDYWMSQYFIPEKFLREVNDNAYHLVNLFCQYFDEASDWEVDVKPFFTCVNVHRQHAILICAQREFWRIYEELLQFPFDLQAIDSESHTVLYYLVRTSQKLLLQQTMKKIQLLTDVTKTDLLTNFYYSDIPGRKQAGDLLTKPLGHTKLGYKSILHPEQIRDRHSFSKQRTRQSLRHLSTQIFFYLEKQGTKLEEVQALYLHYNNHDYIFLVGNPILAFSEKRHTFTPALKANMPEILTKAYPYGGIPHAKEMLRRSKRYADKLQQRVYQDAVTNPAAEDGQDLARTDKIKAILQSAKIEPLSITSLTKAGLDLLNAPAYQEALIILYLEGYATKRMQTRHAEEFLVDIITNLPAPKPGRATYSCIAGKKRPCFGCYGRMHTVVSEHGQHPGHFWSQTIQGQTSIAARRTAKALIEHPSHVSRTRDGGSTTLFDSDSGSEPE